MKTVTEMLQLLDDAHAACEEAAVNLDPNSMTAAHVAAAMERLNEASVAFEQEAKL